MQAMQHYSFEYDGGVMPWNTGWRRFCAWHRSARRRLWQCWLYNRGVEYDAAVATLLKLGQQPFYETYADLLKPIQIYPTWQVGFKWDLRKFRRTGGGFLCPLPCGSCCGVRMFRSGLAGRARNMCVDINYTRAIICPHKEQQPGDRNA